MVKIAPFELEQWADRYENTPGIINIAESCAASISIQDLVVFSDNATSSPLDLSKKMTYGAIRGSETLRQRVADQFILTEDASPLKAENILITQGAIVANFLLLYTLVGPGDHVICVHPTYQQLYSVPESLGAEVSLWKLKEEASYVPDVNDLESLVKSNTKMIILNNPNNPTGGLIPKSVLASVVEFARARDIFVLCDEVYSPLFHSIPEAEFPPSILSFGYDKAISTGSMSKAYALAGIRLGWIASRNLGIIKAATASRDYTTISVSQLDDQIASFALSDGVRENLMKRNIELARTNRAILSEFIDKYSAVVSWVKPSAGTTGFVKFSTKDGQPVDDERFCLDVLDKTKVFFLPGVRSFNDERFKGRVRIGYVCETEVLKKALEKLGEYVEQNLL